MAQRDVDVVVVGGGPIGLAIGWRAAQRGLSVSVVDPSPGSGAASVAAGMLAPITEAHFGEEQLLELNLESASRWDAFAAEVEAASGSTIGYRRSGTLAVALDDDDRAALERLHDYQLGLGLSVSRLRPREARSLEPALAPTIRAAMVAPHDHQVDPRRLCAALVAAVTRAGVSLVPSTADSIVVKGGTVVGVIAGGARISAGWVVLAAGCWSTRIPGLPAVAVPPVRPVKGQILMLQGNPVVERPVRAMARGGSIYLVPREDGRVVVGATVEEMGWDTTVTAGAVYELLRDTLAIVPGASELALVEARAGLRPGTPDNAPLIGRGALPGLAVATGHYRNGILLTPVTADAIASLVASGEVESVALPFSPRRFEPVAAER